jgi:nitrogen regulatory protein P-II 1
MVKIECVLRPEKFEEVKEALYSKGIVGMSVWEIKGCGRQKGYTEHYKGHEYRVNLLPKIKLEIVVKEEQKDLVVNTILESARTNKIGDGKIFIYPILEAVRIRTGERGKEVL